jgi:hypothetical protein
MRLRGTHRGRGSGGEVFKRHGEIVPNVRDELKPAPCPPNRFTNQGNARKWFSAPSPSVHCLYSSVAQTTVASFRANPCRFAKAGGVRKQISIHQKARSDQSNDFD